jgi:L-alanine-DL-glutamate epimerase-like enolase superfamily enzyme
MGRREFLKAAPAMLENPIIPKDGHVEAPELPGLGMRIKPEIWDHPAAVRQPTTI